MLLVCQPQIIKKYDQERDFSFYKFLETNLSDKAVNQLFSKFKKDKIDAAGLVSILTLTVIIYKVKLHQLKTGGSDKPKMDSTKVKKMVEHLACYIVRKFGDRRDEKEEICITDENGEEKTGKYYGYDFSANKAEFASNVAIWVESYMNDEGKIEIDV